MENVIGRFLVRENDDPEQWEVYIYLENETISVWQTEDEARMDAAARNVRVKEFLVETLSAEIAKAIMVDKNSLTLHEYQCEVTYRVSFINEVGTIFECENVYFSEENFEILQYMLSIQM